MQGQTGASQEAEWERADMAQSHEVLGEGMGEAE